MPESDRPPEPAAGTCAECGAEVRATWMDHGRYSRWFEPEDVCAACRGRAEREAAERDLEARVAGSGLPARYRDYTFDRVALLQEGQDFTTWSAELPDGVLGITPWNRRLARELRAWEPGSPSLYVVGPVGGGKTTLAAALVRKLIRSGVNALFIAESALWERVREEMAAPLREHRRRTIDVLSRGRVLVLDDLGTTTSLKAWQVDAIETVVCTRYNDRLPVIVTSNLELPAIADLYGERVVSRLLEMTRRRQVALRGWDWRSAQPHPAAPPATPAPPPTEDRGRPYRDAASAAANDRED